MENVLVSLLGTYTKHHKEIAEKLGCHPLDIKLMENSLYGSGTRTVRFDIDSNGKVVVK